MRKTRVLFVCWGNICRSTMAQSVMAHLLRQAGLSSRVEVDSAGTSDEEEGRPPHRGTVRQLEREGIPLVPHRARQLTRADLESFDWVLVADGLCLCSLRRQFPGAHQARIELLLALDGESRDIADPYYSGDFGATYADVLRGCRALLARLTEEQKEES